MHPRNLTQLIYILIWILESKNVNFGALWVEENMKISENTTIK